MDRGLKQILQELDEHSAQIEERLEKLGSVMNHDMEEVTSILDQIEKMMEK